MNNMKFKSNTRRRALEYEKDLVQQWKKNKTFEKSVEMRSADNAYVLYDGPPFITGSPHYGSLLPSIVKDAVPRYQTMKGKRVERVWGWDCHGLPAENFVEKKLGITDRHDIGTKISLEDYITTARESMVQTSDTWESTIDRIGRWVEFKGGYKTMDKNFMESVWWAFKELYEKGKIYEGERVLMYDTAWATPLSKAEVTMDAGAYQIVTDPSVYTKFKLKGKNVSLLAWTTTPWTLPGNTALAIGKDIEYAEIEIDGERLIIAKDNLDKVLTDAKHNILDYKIIQDIKASDLIGKSYEPLFGNRGESAHKIWSADYVTTESGTGIVHIAPAYGEEDFALARENNIPVIHVLDEYGKYTETEWLGEELWAINKTIAKTLNERGVVWKIDYIRHEYPHNPRTGNRLIYRAHPSWFMDIDGQRTEMLEKNSDNINWFPEHIKHGRFEKTIQTAPDWNLSRDRFWATAMPVWKGIDVDGNEHVKVIGSYAELKELSGVELEDYHRPWVDDITFELDGVQYERIDKVLDCWFESGSMPFAQFHYPFENVEKFEKNFPGDFIVEYVGQVRAWFYYVHAVNVGLFGHNAFKNVIVTGNIAGNDGYKMSKSRGNFTDPNELMDKFSADSLRFMLMSSPLLNGEDFTLHDKDVSDVARKLSMIWNMYDFFTMYAEVDKWEFNGDISDPSEDLTNPMDQWIVSRLHQLVGQVEGNMDTYDIPNAVKPILPFIEDASNWYVRRSRRRFWKSGDDTDKNNAYRTLHYVLVQLSMILAPFTPFLAEELYQKLTGGESVHLLDWPVAGNVNELVVNEMETVREYVNTGLSIRARERQKVRQPLASVAVPKLGQFVDFEDILCEELNVKSVKIGEEFELNLVITPELKSEGISREIIRHIQSARKQAGLNVDDRINLTLITSDKELTDAVAEHSKVIKSETLTVKLTKTELFEFKTEAKIDGVDLTISLAKI
ncbi:isoleucine--tRNA ligase [Candidatus Saccharibacteria bacterium HGW-Saccharibacteria-1]|jgi:isoleucyl-tRNA synthetase|nr:MAG: isoleucine--tRNA ligase [Candidatus Saccharibacteria bacterium HGW-Saccharibacteria-1]